MSDDDSKENQESEPENKVKYKHFLLNCMEIKIQFVLEQNFQNLYDTLSKKLFIYWFWLLT